jgi:hypothetical protein
MSPHGSSLHARFGRMPRHTLLIAFVALAVAGCGGNLETALERLVEARRLSADLLVQFARVVDGGNRAVMSDSEDASIAFAREAQQTTQVVQQDVDALKPVLASLGYSSEARLLEEFQRQFTEYRTLDANILGLAVENTNLKAQQLSFGAAQQAADAFTEALDPIARSAPAQAPWRAAALAATAVAAVREIQVLQAPHISEPEDATMTSIEQRMATSERSARGAVEAMAGLLPPESRSRLPAATAALDRFMSVNGEIIRLSRRNSNVRSLALSLGQKRTLTAKCEETLRSLQDALAQRSLEGGTR